MALASASASTVRRLNWTRRGLRMPDGVWRATSSTASATNARSDGTESTSSTSPASLPRRTAIFTSEGGEGFGRRLRDGEQRIELGQLEEGLQILVQAGQAEVPALLPDLLGEGDEDAQSRRIDVARGREIDHEFPGAAVQGLEDLLLQLLPVADDELPVHADHHDALGVLLETEGHPLLPASDLNFAFRACCTTGSTRADTSPPNRATSRTRLELKYVRSKAGTRNTVSSAGASVRFISAIWNSYSKSDTARSPRIRIDAPTCRAKSTSRPSNDRTSTPGSFTVSRINATRSSNVKSGCLDTFTATATTTWSENARDRRIRSAWPRVTGSKEPGYTAIRVIVTRRKR